ncbi:MAG: carbohydrate kinase [Clostridia bacterium]|nr:carbohydrate kinase [Clostridia bacterium]
MKKYDVTALGEILIDMTYAGKSESGQTLFEQNPGGAPANVLAAVSRLGGKCAFIGKVGSDMHGKFLIDVLKREGITTGGVIEDEGFFTTLAFVNLNEKGERSFSFARKPGADTQLSESEVKYDIIEKSKIFHVGSLSLTDEPARSATMKALCFAKEKGLIISYDPNYRAMLWKSESEAVRGMRSILSYVDIIKVSDEEIKLLTGFEDEVTASEALLSMGIKTVIVTLGEKGALVRNKDGFIYSLAEKVNAVDTTGAGDAFMGGFLYLVAKSGKREFNLEELKEFAAFANKVAGYNVQHRGAINAMPKFRESAIKETTD